MKSIKVVLPEKLYDGLREVSRSKKLIQAMTGDFKRYNKAAFYQRVDQNKDNLRARITLYYHQIEKGLSNKNIRLGFGKKALDNLFSCIEEFKKYDKYYEDSRYKTAASVLKKYIEYHESNSYDVNEVKERYEKIIENIPADDMGGIYEINKEEILSYKESSFDLFSKNRVSVRDFSEEPVDIHTIEKAISISMKTPSVCNRQPWRVYIIKNQSLREQVLKAQKGILSAGDNMDTLLMITSDNQYLGAANERNQGFIDGGMFSMSLIYSLTYVGLASCALNAALTPEDDKAIRDLIKIPEEENIIMFIALGNYPDKFKVPKSHRDNFKEITNYRL